MGYWTVLLPHHLRTVHEPNSTQPNNLTPEWATLNLDFTNCDVDILTELTKHELRKLMAGHDQDPAWTSQ